MPPQQSYRRRVDRWVQSPQSDIRMLVHYRGKVAGTFRQDYSFEGLERRREEKARGIKRRRYAAGCCQSESRIFDSSAWR